MTMDLTKIQAGPCQLTWGGTNLGHTQDGVEFNYEPDIRERVVDKYGSSPVELILIGERVTVVARLTQWELAKMKAAIPAGLQGSDYLGIGRIAGFHLRREEAEELVIHPLEQATTQYDVTLWKTVASAPITIGYTHDGDRVFEVTFFALQDESKMDGQTIGKIGSPS